MSEPKGLLKWMQFFKKDKESGSDRNFRIIWLIAVAAIIIYFIVRNATAIGHVLLVVIGFGAVVLAHEFGHFIIAKLVGIKVEAFSIGFPPIFAGIRRTEAGYRIRILPRFFSKKDDESGDGQLSFTVGKEAQPGETEYRIGLIPFGGFVKMLGQDDVAPDQASDDPRSFSNKPIGARVAVISAGVFLNAVSAVIIFMIVFLIGIDRVPAVVGGVVPNSPAAMAGIQPGDEIIDIKGKSRNLEYYDVAVEEALARKGEEIALKVRHENGQIKDYAIVAKSKTTDEDKGFGIVMPQNLTIASVSDPNKLFQSTRLLPGDRIKAVNGKEVQNHWELAAIVRKALVPEVTVSAERPTEQGNFELIKSKVDLDLVATRGKVESESDLRHIYSIVPRLRLMDVSSGPPSIKDKLVSVLNKIGIGKSTADSTGRLCSGDIILAVGDVKNPTYREFREVTEQYEKKKLPVKVLRVDPNGLEKELTITVLPKRSENGERVVIGILLVPELDEEHAVVAKTIDANNGTPKLEIPRGATITAVDGVSVSNFCDIIREIRRNAGQRITIEWRVDAEVAGDVVLDVASDDKFITVESTFSELIPFELLQRLYKATDPINAIVMGYDKTIMFIVKTYVTIQRLIGGAVSPKSFMGPVGIVTFSYRIVVERPLIEYAYWIGLISAMIAVFNFLPLPPFDGGLVVLLAIEKLKGSPLSEKTQAIIVYVGWLIVGTFILYVTFNDIVRSVFGS